MSKRNKFGKRTTIFSKSDRLFSLIVNESPRRKPLVVKKFCNTFRPTFPTFIPIKRIIFDGLSSPLSESDVTEDSFHSCVDGDSSKEIFSTPPKADAIEVNHASKDFSHLLSACNQVTVLEFADLMNDIDVENILISKVGEGVSGDVYSFGAGSEFVMKIIPVDIDSPSRLSDLTKEVLLTSELSAVCFNFVHFFKARVVFGEYPDQFLDASISFKENKPNEAINPLPNEFSANQNFLILQLELAGKTMEHYDFTNLFQSISLIQQVACAFAMAEEMLKFEHRDLHISNIMFKLTRQKKYTYFIDRKEVPIQLRGVKATIIDYNLSRINYEQFPIFTDYSKDKEMFSSREDYQFQIYRFTRDLLKDDWSQFAPKTNIYWLHYFTDKLLYYKRGKSVNDERRAEIKLFYKKILSYNSCLELVKKSNLLDLR